jgi:hypothetical protein
VWQSGVNAQLVNDQGNVVGVYRIP